MPNLAELRAAVFKLFAKKQVKGAEYAPPPVRVLITYGAGSAWDLF